MNILTKCQLLVKQKFMLTMLNSLISTLYQGRDWEEEARAGVEGVLGQGEVGEHTVEELKDINNQLYKFALKNVLKS